MDSQDRAETRQMIIDLLEPYHKDILYQAKLTNVSLNQIDQHLTKLNGSVAKHEKVINENLPHTVINCAQSTTIGIISKRMDKMVSRKYLYSGLVLAVMAIAAIIELLKYVG